VVRMPEPESGPTDQISRLVSERLADDPGLTSTSAFVSVMGEYLVSDGSLEDLTVCFFRTTNGVRQVEVHGYDLSQDGTTLSLVVAEYGPGGGAMRRERVDRLVRRAAAFVEFVHQGLHIGLEPSGPAFDMTDRIHSAWPQIERVRLVLVTDGVTTLRTSPRTTAAGLPVTVDIWDATRLGRLIASGRGQEEIIIDVLGRGHTVPCVASVPQAGGYGCIMAVVPGQLLAELYEEFHSRLLQRNVRAFLQVRGKINKAINETIRKEPGRFLAYNNGISATASGVEFAASGDGTRIIGRLRDLQIVNGGQTTASLHYAAARGADLSDVHVPAKITVVVPERLDELVPSISRYANSQNAVSLADFEGNSPFHVGLEALSRNIWAPARPGETAQTRWYYERVRGQYEVDRGRLRTPAQRRTFDRENPRNQRISKTDVARVEYAFLSRPQIVCLGAQKCFQQWTTEFETASRDRPEAAYFRALAGRTVLYNGVERVVRARRSGGYYAQTTAYTVALIVHTLGAAGVAVDTEALWRAQQLRAELLAEFDDLAVRVREALVTPDTAANITEWCKKEACWGNIRARVRWSPSPALLTPLGR